MNYAIIDWNLDSVMDNCKYYFWSYICKTHKFQYIGFSHHQNKDIIITNLKEFVNNKKIDVLILTERLLRKIDSTTDLQIDIPKILLINDWHYFRDNKEIDSNWIKNIPQFFTKNNIKTILSVTERIIPHLKELTKIDNIIHFPKCVNIEIFKNYHQPKQFDVISNGTGVHKYHFKELYPFRNYIYNSMPTDINFFVPNYGDIKREIYARFLSSAKIFIFGTGKYHIPVQKCFEGMASDCLVMHNGTLDDNVLEFKDGENFIKINKQNYIDKIRYYLTHDSERQQIITNANELMKRYTIQKRGEQLMGILKQ
jgi:hypothetical protein